MRNYDYDYDYYVGAALIGDAKVGSSSIILRAVDDMFSETYYCHDDFKTKYVESNDKTVRLSIVDINAGRAPSSRMDDVLNCNVRTFLVTYDITNRDSFENVSKWLEVAKKYSKGRRFILVGAKCDLESKRAVKSTEAEAFAQKNEMSYFEVSAKTGHGIENLFKDVVHQDLLKRIPVPPIENEAETQTLQTALSQMPQPAAPLLTARFALNVIASIAAISAIAALMTASVLAALAISSVLSPIAAGVTAANFAVLGTATLLGSVGLFIYANKNKAANNNGPNPLNQGS